MEVLILKYGGWALLILYLVFRIGIWYVRKTETKVDDEILDNYIKIGVDFASSLIPKNTEINWLKFVANALSKFTEAYTKSQGDVPDSTTFEKAKKLIEELAAQKELKELKN